jgi:hypothetical protein
VGLGEAEVMELVVVVEAATLEDEVVVLDVVVVLLETGTELLLSTLIVEDELLELEETEVDDADAELDKLEDADVPFAEQEAVPVYVRGLHVPARSLPTLKVSAVAVAPDPLVTSRRAR